MTYQNLTSKPHVIHNATSFLNPIRVLAVRQPWASLILLGYKTSEIRTTNTNIRERIAIHASRSKPLKKDVDWLRSLGLQDDDLNSLPKGVILGTVSLVESYRIESKNSFKVHAIDHMNNPDWYKDGLYAWKMAAPHLLDTPIEYMPPRGAIVWSCPKGVIA